MSTGLTVAGVVSYCEYDAAPLGASRPGQLVIPTAARRGHCRGARASGLAGAPLRCGQ